MLGGVGLGLCACEAGFFARPANMPTTVAPRPNILNSLATKVKDSYVTRKWSDTAKVVSELVTELLNESQSYEQTLYPGYDFSTQCGLHVGSRLESTGESGFSYVWVIH